MNMPLEMPEKDLVTMVRKGRFRNWRLWLDNALLGVTLFISGANLGFLAVAYLFETVVISSFLNERLKLYGELEKIPKNFKNRKAFFFFSIAFSLVHFLFLILLLAVYTFENTEVNFSLSFSPETMLTFAVYLFGIIIANYTSNKSYERLENYKEIKFDYNWSIFFITRIFFMHFFILGGLFLLVLFPIEVSNLLLITLFFVGKLFSDFLLNNFKLN